MVAKLVDYEANELAFVYDSLFDVLVVKLRPQLDDGVKDGVNGFCMESLKLGRVSGGHNVLVMTFCHFLKTFWMASMSIHGFYAKTCSFCKTTCSSPSSLFVPIFNSFNAS
jgi:hypothetical protein